MINKTIKTYDTIIFDFDGTLIDSEPIHIRAHSILLSEVLGRRIELTPADFERYIGRVDADIFDLMKVDYQVSYDTSDMVSKKAKLVRGLLLDPNIKIFNYFYTLAKQKTGHYYVVSNQYKDTLMEILRGKDILKYFDQVFSMPDMNITKNDFYQSLHSYIPNVHNVAVFEDDPKMIAKLKGMHIYTVAIENEINKNQIDIADHVIHTKQPIV